MKNSLKNKKDIDNLFIKGKSTMVGNVLIKVYDGTPGFVFAVSTKNFKRAVDRNRIKRLMRNEVKGITPTKSVAIVYVGKEIPKKIEIRKFILKIVGD
jgi:ribonuclease P protein component